MTTHRVFLSQETLDEWLEEGRAEIDGEVMTWKAQGLRFELKTAVHFLREVAEGGDRPNLVGRVKDTDQLVALGAEHYADSVILGDDAYEVIEGFAGTPIRDVATGHSLEAAVGSTVGDGPGEDVDLLARFFLSNK